MGSTLKPQISVVVAGALGRMGAEVVRAVHAAPDCELTGAVDNTPGKEGVDMYYHYQLAHDMDGTDPTYVSPLALRLARAGDVKGALPLFELAVSIADEHRKPKRRVDPYLNLLVTYRNLRSKSSI